MPVPFPLSRRQFLKSVLAIAAWFHAAVPWRSVAQAPIEQPIDVSTPSIQAPRSPALWPVFRRQLTEWRDQARRALDYRDVRYRDESAAWT